MKRKWEGNTIVCVKNLPRNKTEKEIIQFFSNCDFIKEIRLPTFKGTTELKGIGFIDVSNE
jgi:RNA recognition motif-containing protein